MKIAKSFAAFGLAAALSGSLGASTLDFYYEPQQHSNWCWVATAKNLLVHYGVNQPQCDLANIALVRRDACGSGPYNWQHPANVTGAMFGYPTGVDVLLQQLGGRRTQGYEGPMGWNGLTTNIDKDRPLVAQWAYPSTDVAHLVTIYGYDEENGERHVDYIDPFPGEGRQYASYDWVKDSGDIGRLSHRWTFSLEVE